MLPVRVEALVRVGAVVHDLQLARLVVVAVPGVLVSVVGLGVYNMLAWTYINFGILTHISVFLTPKNTLDNKKLNQKLKKKVHLPLPQFTF